MSITSALRTQQGSIRELALLPQEQLIRMAQTNQLSSEILPVVLSEKANLIKEGERAKALMQAQMQGKPMTITEQNMSTIAASEMPKMQAPMPAQMPAQAPQMSQAPQDSGIGALPVGDNVFRAAGGGIVAFAGEDGSLVGGEETGGAQLPKSFQDQLEDRYKAEMALREKYLGPASQTQSEARNLALLKAGLGILGGTSPYALTNIGAGAQAGAEQYATSMKDIRAAQEKALESAFKRQADLDEKRIAAAKSTDLDRTTASELAALAAQGYDPKDPRVQAQARRNAYNLVGLKSEQFDLARQQSIWERNRRASEAVDAELKLGKTSESIEYMRLQTEDRKNGTNKAEEFRKRLFNRKVAEMPIDERQTMPSILPPLTPPSAGTPGEPPKAAPKPGAAKAEPSKPAAAKPAEPQINTGNDLTTSRLTGKELAAKKAQFGNDPAINKRLEEAEKEAKRVIAAEKNPKKVTSQADFDNLPEGTVYVLPNGEKGIKGSAPAQPSTQATKKTPPGLQKPPDLATISGVPKGATYGTYVAGKGWQVIATDPKTGKQQVIGHIDPTKQLAKPKE